ncbi:MAG TPA: uracil-DNA glycosylase [Anaerolineaceae bacterium]|nr:uracil-DNA glycosylase [Anaerolineaceae bacterium]
MQAEEALDTVRQEVRVCKACKLSENRKNAVPGEGPASAQVMFIGEGPGFHENEQGKPFVGQAGHLLDQLLEAAGLQREEVFITNVVKCRPPQNRDPEPDELACCRGYLDRQIETIKPKVIVTLGRFSMARFIENGKIGAIHGKSHLVDGQMVVTMYHPAAALHQPALKGTLMADFASIRHLLERAQKDEKSSKPAPVAQTPIETKAKQEPENVTPEQLSLF